MYAYIRVKNQTSYPVISTVSEDDVLYFYDIIKGDITRFKACFFGSCCIRVYNNREKEILSLWLSLAPRHYYTLKIFDSGYMLKEVSHS